MSEPRRLDVVRDGHVATVALAGPDGKSVMDEAVFLGLEATFQELDADEDVRAVVLTGSGGNLSHGLDLKQAFETFAPLLGHTDAGPRVEFLQPIRRWQATLDAVDLASACDAYGWRPRTRPSASGRRRWRSSPTSAAFSGSWGSSGTVTSASSPSPPRTSTRPGPSGSAGSTPCTPMPARPSPQRRTWPHGWRPPDYKGR